MPTKLSISSTGLSQHAQLPAWNKDEVPADMLQQKLSQGVAHKIPKDLSSALRANSKSIDAWEDITPLARNEWICWVENAKLIETRNRRIKRTADDLAKGKRRPCCWAGCIHRKK